MSHNIPYLLWRDNLPLITPENKRLGDDFLVVDINHTDDGFGGEPFLCDVTFSIVVTKGWSEVSINMRKYRIEAPAVVIVMSDSIVNAIGSSLDMEGFALIMSGRVLSPMFNNASLSTSLRTSVMKNPVIELQDLNPFTWYKTALENLLASDSCAFKMETVQHLTLALFYGYMLGRHKETMPESSTRNEEITKNFLTLVEDEYKNHREVHWYSDKMCITPKYLSMAVKEASGRTPLDWIEEYCVIAAKAMLFSTRMSIDDISVRLNFASQSLFGKFFKRVTGITPRDYRKSLGR